MRIASSLKTLEIRKDSCVFLPRIALAFGKYSSFSLFSDSAWKGVFLVKTALKVTLLPQGSSIHFEAGVGIWGQQAIPTVISMLFFWPVLLTQIWGMVEQSKLDDKALEIAEGVVYMNSNTGAASASSAGSKFCTSCGTQNAESANFCCGCGKPL